MKFHLACEAELVNRKVHFTRIAGEPEQRLISAIAAVDELLASPQK
jgi:nicotinamide riboside kinase